ATDERAGQGTRRHGAHSSQAEQRFREARAGGGGPAGTGPACRDAGADCQAGGASQELGNLIGLIDLSGLPTMRVIAGSAKGRSLKSPPESTRPITDRVKENLFNIL